MILKKGSTREIISDNIRTALANGMTQKEAERVALLTANKVRTRKRRRR